MICKMPLPLHTNPATVLEQLTISVASNLTPIIRNLTFLPLTTL